jgi:hypothetical protein
MRTIAALIVLGSLVLGCSSNLNSASEHGGGESYKLALVSLIRASDRIVATEHSDELDLFNVDGKTELTEQIIYETVELSSAQRTYFEKTVQALDPTTQDAFPACIPSIHHTLKFYAAGKLLDTIDVCFECGQVIWSGTRATPPWALYPGLAKVIEHIGFSTERDWAAVVREHIGGARPNKSLERTREG